MDAEKTIKELGRMCYSMENCADCNVSMLRDEEPRSCMHYIYKYPAETIRIIEEWSKAHPIQTRREMFKKVFGVEPISCDGKVYIAPLEERHCNECEYDKDGICGFDARAWWDAPYEAPKGADK